jgi:hypothetical protein
MANPSPEVSRPVWPQRAGQLNSPEPPARGALATLPLGIGAGEVDAPVWSVSDRGTGGLRSSRADTRTPVPPWPRASTMIQWRQPLARAWLRLD